jgi:hypothetical protein
MADSKSEYHTALVLITGEYKDKRAVAKGLKDNSHSEITILWRMERCGTEASEWLKWNEEFDSASDWNIPRGQSPAFEV